jgi:hypothetical protein
MDPNQALKDARETNAEADAAMERGDQEAAASALIILANRFEALDEWLTRGGFLPEAWKAAR